MKRGRKLQMAGLKIRKNRAFVITLLAACTIAAGCSDTEKFQQEEETSAVIVTETRDTEKVEVYTSESLQDPNFKAAPAGWSVNTKLAASIPVLDFADDNVVIMHDYFGLFIHNLDTGEIENSIDLQALGYDFHNDSSCRISVSGDGSTIWRWVASSELLYEYDRISGKLTITGDASEKDTFEDFVLTDDVPPEKLSGKPYRCSRRSVLFADGSYGALYIRNERITGISYTRNGREWVLFSEKNCTAPELIRQDDVFYEQFVYEGSKSADSLMFAYCTMIDYGEYAGICELSDGVAYSEELQKEWNALQLTASSIEVKTASNKACFKVYIMASGPSPDSGLFQGMNEKYIYLKKQDGKWHAEGFWQDAAPDGDWWKDCQ